MTNLRHFYLRFYSFYLYIFQTERKVNTFILNKQIFPKNNSINTPIFLHLIIL
ncbi:hypothetical protein EVA_19552 [gut metagenome]|uniref:Uncharacterized protein n=1 Tax=gut metagenome TaxID=749906 RepID=J9FBR9_9ZZZZ